MSASSVILDLLGLTPTINSVNNAITATKQGVQAINAAKELLDTPDGKKFKKKIIEILGGTVMEADGKVVVDVVKEKRVPQVARGHYEWDAFSATGWVWVPGK